MDKAASITGAISEIKNLGKAYKVLKYGAPVAALGTTALAVKTYKAMDAVEDANRKKLTEKTAMNTKQGGYPAPYDKYLNPPMEEPKSITNKVLLAGGALAGLGAVGLAATKWKKLTALPEVAAKAAPVVDKVAPVVDKATNLYDKLQKINDPNAKPFMDKALSLFYKRDPLKQMAKDVAYKGSLIGKL